MKNKFLPFVLLMSAYSAYSQVGVGTLEPNPSSQLEVMATNKGVLIPRIALKSTADVSTIANGNVNSLLVFNTAKTTDVTPGYYYWYDGKWNKILVSGDANVSAGAVVFNPVTNEFTYTNAGGVGEKIDLSTIIGANETKTNIVKNTDGTYTYNAEAGGKYTIDVIGDVANNFDTIVNNDNVQKILNSLITNVQGSVSFDATKNEFTYVDASGAKQVINIGGLIKDLVKDSETKTSIDKETDGTYTYNSEDGTYTIDVIGDVTSQFSTIVNNTDVKNILNTIVKNAEGNVTYNVTDTKFTYTDAAGNQQDVAIGTIVKANETKTSIDKETDGTYTYNSENGTYTIDVIGDVTSQFSTIVNNTDVKNILNTIVKNAEGNVTYNVTDTKFTYTDAAGNQQDVAIGTIVKANESKTSIDKETDGTYTYNSENGTYTIDVIGDVTSQFSTIVNNTDVKNILNTIVKNAEGNVTYNVTDTKFTYTDAAGNQQDVAIGTIVKANESKTSIDKETDGTYTYNSENSTYTIDVIGDVTSQFSTIVNNTDVKNILNTIVKNAEGNVTYNATDTKFTYTDAAGNQQDVAIGTIVKANESKTSIDKETDGTYTYNSEDGTYTIDVIGDVTSQFSTIVNNTDVKNILNTIVKNAEGNVTYNVTDTKFTYTDAAGNQQDVAIGTIVKANESKTSIDKETDGTYTYNSEDGTYTIDVIGDVTSQFSTIVNNTDVKNILNTIVKNAEGNVTYNVTDTKFTYTDAAGNQQDVAIGTIVKANESKTSIDKETDGTYTYNSEDGTYTIDVIGDVTSQFSTIVNNTDVKNILNTIVKNAEGNVTYNVTDTKFTYTDAAGNQQDVAIGTIVKANESKTSIDKETDGTYTYNSEDGTYTIDVIGDVTSQFSTIVNNADVKNILNSIVNNVEGNVLYNTATSEFTYKDNTGTEQVIDIATLSKEPWFGVTSKVGAISNTEDIYTMGWAGIGFDAPSGAANEKLRVNGVITTVNNVYADYVFEDYFKGYSDIKTDYKFKGLKEIENFIKTNKHLPGITPIGELTKTKAGYSFNLTELSIQLLEKTEEIYLHIIEQNNTIIAKDKELNELKETSKNMSDRLERLERLMEKMNVSDSKNSLK
ncbi:hypothetical protein [Flavobacterium sp. 2]|uniref:beta strand repeat-containing protein n=1 Tax=Flavobacterium sp. 2 TaxID=308053 RepID=UPI000C1853F5|nr:hypothetical protein [Flavobacterium sp. 2]PIF70489.1 hypothetical protein CLU99_1228 [Flavobacterium sp. 2]